MPHDTLSGAGAPHPYVNVPLTLLSGVGRSGTTALRESLGKHPDVHSTERENNIICDLMDTAWRNRTLPARRYGMRVDDATYDRLFRDLTLSLLWPRARSKTPSRLLAFSNITPHAGEYLAGLFPGLKIVYIVRNGIEVIASRMRFESFRSRPVDDHSIAWSQSATLAKWGAARSDFLLVRHERLIAEGGPAAEVERILGFLSLPPCAANLSGTTYHPTPEKLTEATAPKPLSTRSERWKDWSLDQLTIFDRIAGHAMEYFGYERPWRSNDAIAELKQQIFAEKKLAG